MPYASYVLTGIQQWFRKRIKDGKFCRSNLCKDVSERVALLDIPETLLEARDHLNSLGRWMHSLDEATARIDFVAKLRKKVFALTRVVNCALSREGYSLYRGSNGSASRR